MQRLVTWIFAGFLLLLTTLGCRHTAPDSIVKTDESQSLPLDAKVLEGTSVNWSASRDYAAMNIAFEPILALKKAIEMRDSITLQSRGEAHITVLAPQEMAQLRTKLSLEQINRVIEKADIQKTQFEVVCVGRGSVNLLTRKLSTYFLVVRAEGLVTLREQLSRLFVKAGGVQESFQAQLFYPHITIGFTDRDLHQQDGIIKDSKSCIYPIELQR